MLQNFNTVSSDELIGKLDTYFTISGEVDEAKLKTFILDAIRAIKLPAEVSMNVMRLQLNNGVASLPSNFHKIDEVYLPHVASPCTTYLVKNRKFKLCGSDEFRNSEILVYYTGYPVDDENNMELPSFYDLEMAILWYVVHYMIVSGIKPNNPQVTMDYAHARYVGFKRAAQSNLLWYDWRDAWVMFNNIKFGTSNVKPDTSTWI